MEPPEHQEYEELTDYQAVQENVDSPVNKEAQEPQVVQELQDEKDHQADQD